VHGWAARNGNDTALALDAEVRACAPRDGLIHYTDLGSPYAGADDRDRLVELKALPSMSRKGDCWVNAVAESSFSAP